MVFGKQGRQSAARLQTGSAFFCGGLPLRPHSPQRRNGLKVSRLLPAFRSASLFLQKSLPRLSQASPFRVFLRAAGRHVLMRLFLFVRMVCLRKFQKPFADACIGFLVQRELSAVADLGILFSVANGVCFLFVGAYRCAPTPPSGATG